MSQITIALDENTQRATGLYVPIDVLDGQLKVVDKVTLRTPDKAVVDVRPGVYLIRAELPTGELVSTTVRVAAETSEVNAQLRTAEPSPHESLAWAYAKQSVSQASGRTRLAAGWDDPEARLVNFGSTLSKGGGLESLGAAPPSRIRGVYRQVAPGPEWRWTHADVMRRSDQRVTDEDDRLLGQDTIDVSDIDTPPERCAPLYVFYRAHGQPRGPATACVTVPTSTDPTLLFVRNETGGQGAIPVRALVRGAGHMAEVLLSYLEQGSIESARRLGGSVLETAVEALDKKKSDPFGAAIGGYYLLLAGETKQWQWMRNLAEWFPRIPDGALIYGVCCLRVGTDKARLREGRQWLLDAVNRGIPTYTVGLRLLFDALRGLEQRAPDDAEVLAALARVRPIAACADWTAQTTTITLPTPLDRLPISVPSDTNVR